MNLSFPPKIFKYVLFQIYFLSTMASNNYCLGSDDLSENEFLELSQKSTQSQFQVEDDENDPDYENESQSVSSSEISSQDLTQVFRFL